MDINTKLPKKQFYIILFSLGFVIFSLSLEVMMKVKDITLYNEWINNALEEGLTLNYEGSFGIYVSTNLSDFVQKLIVPMSLGVHTYFAYTKIRISKLFVFIWTVFILGSIAYRVIEFNLDSIFYYIIIGLYIAVVVAVLSLVDVINENKLS